MKENLRNIKRLKLQKNCGKPCITRAVSDGDCREADGVADEEVVKTWNEFGISEWKRERPRERS